MKRHFAQALLTLGLSLLLGTTAQASLIGYESFTHTSGANLAGLSANSGFTAWDGTSTGKTGTKGLSYKDSSGNTLTTAGLSGSSFNGTDQGGKSFNNFPDTSSGKLYVSFLIAKNAPGIRECDVVLSSTSWSNDQLIFGTAGYSNTEVLQTFAGGGTFTALTTYGNTIVASRTNLVVMEFNFGVANTPYTTYINPVLSLPLTDAANTARIAQTGTFGAANMQAFQFRADGQGQGLLVDEVRLGTTYADVVPYGSAPVSSITNLTVSVAAAPSSLAVNTSSTLTATVHATNVTVTGVEFYTNGVLIGTDNLAPYTFSFSRSVSGSVTATARALSTFSNVTSAGVTVTFTNTPPPPVGITNLTVTVAAAPSILAVNTLSTLTATVHATNVTVTGVQFYTNGTLIGTDNIAPYTFSFTRSVAGSVTATARALSTFSNVTSSGVTVTFTNTPPPPAGITNLTVSIAAVPSKLATNTFSTLTATVHATNVTVTGVEFYTNGVLIGTDNISPYTFSFTSPIAGVYVATAKALSTFANVTSSGVQVTFTNKPVVVAITNVTVSLAAVPSSLATNTFSTLTATVNATNVTVTGVEFYTNGTLIGTDNIAPYTFSFTRSVAGAVTATAKALSSFSTNTFSAGVVVTFTNKTSGTTPTASAGSGDFLNDGFADILVYKKPTLSVLNVSNNAVINSVALTLPDPKAKVLAANHIGTNNFIAFQIKKSLRVIKYVGGSSSQQGTDVAIKTLGGKVYASGDVDNDGIVDLFTVKKKTVSVVKGPSYSTALPITGIGGSSKLPGKLVGAYQLAGNTNVVLVFQKGKNPPTSFNLTDTTATPGATAPTGSGKIYGLATDKAITKVQKSLQVGGLTVYTDKVTLGSSFKYGKVVGPK